MPDTARVILVLVYAVSKTQLRQYQVWCPSYLNIQLILLWIKEEEEEEEEFIQNRTCMAVSTGSDVQIQSTPYHPAREEGSGGNNTKDPSVSRLQEGGEY